MARESASNNQVSLYRRIRAKLAGQRLYSPHDLIGPHRLDIAAKTVFARAYIEGNTSTWPEELYREHIRAWNGFYEKAPLKNSYEDFRRSFVEVIESAQNGKFRHHEAPVSLDREGKLENGAHRVSTALVLDRFVNTFINEEMTAGQWNHDFFSYWAFWAREHLNTGLAEEYVDAMTVEYIALAPRQMYVVIVFPTAEDHRDEADGIIRSFGDVLNVKEIPAARLNAKAVIRQLYAGEWWNDDDHLEHVVNKAEGCFAGTAPLRVYIVRSDLDEAGRREEKVKLRAMWGKENHSIHISDTPEEAHRLTRMFFHAGSRAVLGVELEREFPAKFGRLFREFMAAAPSDIRQRDDICIDSSSTLGILGLRDVNDIDYLHRGEALVRTDNPDISSHNEHAHWYADSIDEIVTNPRLHFYYNGIKFAAPAVVRAMKANRGEEKDKRDVALIDGFMNNHKEFYVKR
ncbi:hypothetical protein JNJ66_07115 [Candidatus Saccharibacteria bacterium]|nr:hypothetical protein [Candidatus Saccharibacteria bacterium]